MLSLTARSLPSSWAWGSSVVGSEPSATVISWAWAPAARPAQTRAQSAVAAIRDFSMVVVPPWTLFIGGGRFGTPDMPLSQQAGQVLVALHHRVENFGVLGPCLER